MFVTNPRNPRPLLDRKRPEWGLLVKGAPASISRWYSQKSDFHISDLWYHDLIYFRNLIFTAQSQLYTFENTRLELLKFPDLRTFESISFLIFPNSTKHPQFEALLIIPTT